MLARAFSTAFLISLILFTSYAYAYVVGTASIHVPAVIPENNSEALTLINLTVTNGNGHVSVIGPAVVGGSTTQSAYTAAQYGSSYLHLNFTNYNFTYTVEANSSNVTGPSAGAAMTLLAISALKHKQLRNDFTITGTISSDGTVGAVGGVYNKVQAAYQNGLDLVLVPAVPSGSRDAELYLLVQTEFGMPVVQVSNITQASLFAFNSSINGVQYETKYNFYTNYSIEQLPQSTLTCSNSCNDSAFRAMADYTLNFTSDMIKSLGTSGRFYNISLQLNSVLNQSAQIERRGYLYMAADFAFLDYIDVFYFYSHDTTTSSALSNLENVQALCSSLIPPQITSDNYEYLLGAELRQAWGNYMINNTIETYNKTATNTDSILESLRGGAEASGWCNAAGFIYNRFANPTGYPINFSASLAGTALQRLERAAQYPGMYLTTAQQAYRSKNYPVAILDADYAFAMANASESGLLQTQQLLSMSQSIIQNSTYGVWATEFAKESQFYAYQAGATGNATSAHTYALQAYSSALLAEQISSDTRLIYNSAIPISISTSNATLQSPYLINVLNQLTYMERFTTLLLALVVILLAANLVLITILIRKSTEKTTRRRRRR